LCWSCTCNLSLKILVPSGTQLNYLETKLPLSYHPQAMHHVEIPSLKCSKSTITLNDQLTNLRRCHRLTFWRSEALISDCTPNLAIGICRNSHQKTALLSKSQKKIWVEFPAKEMLSIHVKWRLPSFYQQHWILPNLKVLHNTLLLVT